MITDNEINNLKKGDKLICIQNHGLYAKVNNLYTFHGWWAEERNGKWFWQTKEMLEFNFHTHNFEICHFEIYDKTKHKEFNVVTLAEVDKIANEFVKKYGG